MTLRYPEVKPNLHAATVLWDVYTVCVWVRFGLHCLDQKSSQCGKRLNKHKKQCPNENAKRLGLGLCPME